LYEAAKKSTGNFAVPPQIFPGGGEKAL